MTVLTKSRSLKKIFVLQIKFYVQSLSDCIVPAKALYLDCHFCNLMYLKACSKCHLQYVGEIIQKQNERIHGHKTGFRNPSKHEHSQVLYKHFTSGMFKRAMYQIQIIKRLPGHKETNSSSMDPSWTQIGKLKNWVNQKITHSFSICSKY